MSSSPPLSPPPTDELWLPEFGASPWDAEGAMDQDTNALAPSPSSDSDSCPPERHEQASRASVLAVRRRRAYRSRKKSEISELRVASAALAATRDELEAKREARSRRLLGTLSRKRFVGGWKGVAARQLQGRIDAERLNRELRVQLCQTHGEVQQLVGLLASQLSLLDAKRLSALLHTQQPKETLCFSECDMPTVNALVKEVAAMIGHAYTVLNRCELPAMTASQAYNYSRAWRRAPKSSGEFLELVETRRVTFDFDVAVTALEKTVVLMFSTQCQPALLHLPGGMIALKFSLSCVDEERRSRRFESIYVGKMVVESNRAALCWRCVSGEEAASNQFQETGWGMVQRATSTSLDSGTSFTYFSCVEGEKKEVLVPARDLELKKFVKMTPSTEKETIVWYNAMESVVMQGGASEWTNGQQAAAL